MDNETLVQNDLQTIIAANVTGFPVAANETVPPANITIIEAPSMIEALTATNPLTPLPQIFICSRKITDSGLGFEGAVNRVYVEEVVVVDGRDGDLTSYMAQIQSWRWQAFNACERTSTGFRTSLPTATTVYDVRVQDEVPGIERTKLGSNYAYLSFFVVCSSSE